MKEDRVTVEQLGKIKSLFDGYIFNRIDEEGNAWISCYLAKIRLIKQYLGYDIK